MLWPKLNHETVTENLERSEVCYQLLLGAGSDLSSVFSDRFDANCECSVLLSDFSLTLIYGTLIRRFCHDLVSAQQLTTFRPK